MDFLDFACIGQDIKEVRNERKLTKDSCDE